MATWHFGEDRRNSEGQKRGNGHSSGKESEEDGLRLPAVRHAASVEVGSDYVRQLRVIRPKVDGRENGQHDEYGLG